MATTGETTMRRWRAFSATRARVGGRGRVGKMRVRARGSSEEEYGEIVDVEAVDARLARLDALGARLGAVYATTDDDEDDGRIGRESVSVERIQGGALIERGGDVDTVQLIACKFQMKRTMAFGEELRLVGSHAKLGSWDMNKSLTLTWGEGDVWTSDDVELPVDGVFIYKYAVVPAGQPAVVKEWQSGNNQVLTLSSNDHPRLWIYDAWSGDPNKASIYREDGLSENKEERLINRVKNADDRVKMVEQEVKYLQEDLQTANAKVNALREEARLAANVRIALKEQLKAEQQRSNVLSSQIDAWKMKFMQLSDGQEKTGNKTVQYDASDESKTR
ncbi:Carbohydrate binding module family 20 [Ostreococcus tauri]|uniref:Carbohydrate binding module family 20 n=2 Tax=Ostreococcus tauri TaxID=70448 RepID=A0A090M264_OSTTA|nr:Carbohydrate binding module family 20 [Ostreococcus tauri]CEF98325.1 Carbohydrate binding module family 20 [Ostreococcus tauri]|eukprot:XP_003079819.2 Carbohydrate binding module family 20 [Ostreococcus tauri]